MADKRIIALAEASNLSSDDCFIIDSPTLGTRKISKDQIAISFTDDGEGNITIALS